MKTCTVLVAQGHTARLPGRTLTAGLHKDVASDDIGVYLAKNPRNMAVRLVRDDVYAMDSIKRAAAAVKPAPAIGTERAKLLVMAVALACAATKASEERTAKPAAKPATVKPAAPDLSRALAFLGHIRRG